MNPVDSIAVGLSTISIVISLSIYFLLTRRINKANLNINEIAVDLNKVPVDDENQTWDGR